MPRAASAHALLIFLAFGAQAAAPKEAAPAALPQRLTESSPCVTGAAEYHGVNPWVLKAILKVESGFNPSAYNRNANGTVDVGMAQINSIHFRKLQRFGVGPADLMDGCVATYVAAWHLAAQIREHGNTWFGIASYHSTSACQNGRYAALLWNALLGWGVVQGQALKVPTLRACGYIAPRAASRAGEPSGAAVAFDAE